MISQRLLTFEQRSPQLPIHILPAHQQVIIPLPAGYVGPAMAAGETWMRRFGYKAISPWLISWGSTGAPHLRRPVTGALRAVDEDGVRTVEYPSLLMLAVPFQGWPVLPHHLMPFVRAQGFDAIGQPLLLALGNDPPNVAWVPVTPRGTLSLMRAVTATGASRKIGYFPTPPEPGVLLGLSDLLHSAWRATLHTFVLLSLFALLPLNCVGGTTPILWLGLASNIFEPLLFFITMIAIVLALIFMVNLVVYGLATKRWNDFWRDRAAPPTLVLHGSIGTEAEVPAWLGDR